MTFTTAKSGGKAIEKPRLQIHVLLLRLEHLTFQEPLLRKRKTVDWYTIQILPDLAPFLDVSK